MMTDLLLTFGLEGWIACGLLAALAVAVGAIFEDRWGE